MMEKENKEHICKECGLIFNSHSLKANHIRWYHKDTQYSEEGLLNLKNKKIKSDALKYGEYITEKVVCNRCNKNVFEIKYRYGKKKEKNYCSRSCANGGRHDNITDEGRKILSDKTKKLWTEPEYLAKMMVVITNRGNQKSRFNSKNELIIKEYFKKTFPEDMWTSGAGIIYEGKTISRDLYSKKLKISLEYDGIWHFKDIKGQLANKQEKDKLLEKWTLENGWRLIRISEDYYLKDKETSLLELISCVYNKNENIIKLY